MNQKLQNILDIIQQSEKLDAEQKDNLMKAVKDADKELEITAFKLERTEKVKKTTAILLEETIEELEQKRKAVEAQNHELEIEASLERVRAVAMSMNKSDDLLSICEVSFKEFQKLGFDSLRNTIIHILNDEKGFFLDYDYSDYLGGSIIKINYNAHPVVEDYLKQIKRADDAFAEVIIDGIELNDWKDFRRSGGQADDPKLDKTKALYYYLYSIGVGDIGISTLKPINESQVKILKRFRNVFDLAYRTYTEITKAEAQAREAQIQLALERVRARTMAMQKSEELKDVIQLVYEQFVQLNIHVEHAGFIMDYRTRDDMYIWLADKNAVPFQVTIPYFDCAHWNSFNEAKEKGKNFFANHLSFEEKNKFYKVLFKFIPGVPEETIKYYFKCPGLAISTVLLDKVGLYIENFDGIPYTDEENNTLMRFGRVFLQTYTRFLDLQKAEARAREAKVEAALERVRSLALGMRKSEEVGNVTDRLFTELTELSVDVNGCSIVVIDEDSDKMELWRARSNVAIKPFESTSFIESMNLLKKNMPDWSPTFFNALEKRKNNIIDELSGDRRSNFINVIAEQYKYSSAEKSNLLKNTPEKIATHYIFFNLGYLALLGEKKLSDENLSIARRFVEVFEFSYTRFWDIKKAEAQAREAQIEAALERVRSRTMAMHKSDELSETAGVLFEQMVSLGIVPKRCIISIINQETNNASFWLTSSDGKVIPGSDLVPLTEEPHLIATYQAWKEKKTHFSFKVSGEERLSWTMYVINKVKMHLPEYQPDTLNKEQILNEPAVFNSFFFSHGFVMLHTVEDLTDEHIKMLKRFASVFEQTYTRFLDLKKAEAQAREAQIEAALERVRSRSMAMHHTSELQDVINTVHQQFKLLDIAITGGVFIAVNDENKNEIKCWGAGGTADYVERVHIPFFDKPIYTTLINSIQQGPGFFTVEFTYEEKVEFFNHLFEHPPYSDGSPERKKEILSRQGGYTRSCTVSKYTCVFIINHHGRRFSEEENDILIRFGKVFEQSYTRFLDLQKAEAQAREAQIEAALERVRAKAMAMQSSNDFANIVETVFTELKKVGFKTIRCGIGIIESAETKKADIWSTTLADEDLSIQISGDEVLEGHSLLDGIIEHWINQTEFLYILKGEDFLKYYKTIEKTNFHLPEYAQQNLSKDEKQYYFMVPCKAGGIYAFSVVPFTDEVKKLMRRFIEVFQLAYTRYVDLQKAEAQAKEAIKQASLDRVRAQIASMRTSEDLNHITPIIWRELKNLEVPFFRCGIYIVDEKTETVQVYLTTPEGKSLGVLNLAFDSSKVTSETVEYWRKKQVYKQHWNKEEFINWTKSLIEIGQVKNAETYQGSATPPESLDLHFVPFAQGMLYVGDINPLTDEKLQLVKTLAEAFSIAYARYEDFKRLEEAKAAVESAFGELDGLSKELKVKNEKLEIENLRKANELEEARRLQLAMLPDSIPELDNFKIAVYMQTATEVGGDYYDFNVGEDGTITTVIGDATGHGMKAGTIVTITKSLFNSLASSPDILTSFSEISRVIKEMKFRRLSMCLMMMKIKENKLSISSAAMPPALIYRKKDKVVEEIFLKGMPLGAMNNFPYTMKESYLQSGDTILLLSDGLPELTNESKEMYGYERTISEFCSVGNQEPEQIVNHLKNSASKWLNGKEQDDDVTFVVIKLI